MWNSELHFDMQNEDRSSFKVAWFHISCIGPSNTLTVNSGVGFSQQVLLAHAIPVLSLLGRKIHTRYQIWFLQTMDTQSTFADEESESLPCCEWQRWDSNTGLLNPVQRSPLNRNLITAKGYLDPLRTQLLYIQLFTHLCSKGREAISGRQVCAPIFTRPCLRL